MKFGGIDDITNNLVKFEKMFDASNAGNLSGGKYVLFGFKGIKIVKHTSIFSDESLDFFVGLV